MKRTIFIRRGLEFAIGAFVVTLLFMISVVRAYPETVQVIVGTNQAGIGAFTAYLPPFAALDRDTDVNRVQIPASPPGTLRNFRVRVSVAPGVGKSFTFTFMKNGVDQSLSVVISDTNTTGEDTTNSFTVSAGDRIAIRAVGTTGTPNSIPSWAFEFVPDVDNNFWIGAVARPNTGATVYTTMYGGRDSTYEETYVKVPMPVGGTFSNLYVKQNVDPGTYPDAFTYRLRVNGGDGNLTCTIVADYTSCNDTVNSDSVIAGDLVNTIVVPVSTPALYPWAGIGLTFVPSLSGYAPVFLGNRSLSLSNSSDNYNVAAGYLYNAWDSVDDTYVLTNEATLRNLYVFLIAAPGSGKSYTVTMRKNASDSTVSCTVSGTNTTCNDVSNTEGFANGDRISVEASPINSPTSSALSIGYVLVYGAAVPEPTPTPFMYGWLD